MWKTEYMENNWRTQRKEYRTTTTECQTSISRWLRLSSWRKHKKPSKQNQKRKNFDNESNNIYIKNEAQKSTNQKTYSHQIEARNPKRRMTSETKERKKPRGWSAGRRLHFRHNHFSSKSGPFWMAAWRSSKKSEHWADILYQNAMANLISEGKESWSCFGYLCCSVLSPNRKFLSSISWWMNYSVRLRLKAQGVFNVKAERTRQDKVCPGRHAEIMSESPRSDPDSGRHLRSEPIPGLARLDVHFAAAVLNQKPEQRRKLPLHHRPPTGGVPCDDDGTYHENLNGGSSNLWIWNNIVLNKISWDNWIQQLEAAALKKWKRAKIKAVSCRFFSSTFMCPLFEEQSEKSKRDDGRRDNTILNPFFLPFGRE